MTLLDQSDATVAVLFARADSIYKTMPDCDVYDIERDAMTYSSDDIPVVAHPPCTRWSMMNGVVLSRYPHKSEEFAWGNDGGTFEFALATVRRCGGVLEHPAESRAFWHYGLPRIGRGPDRWRGWSCEVRQCDWGHREEKRTWLYIVGLHPDDLPDMPPHVHGTATARVSRMASDVRTRGFVEVMGKAEREHTPPAFAEWLVELARRCRIA